MRMYDAIVTANIPHDAEAVAGYVNGRWPTFNSLRALFPKAHRLSIAVNASADAECLDVEPGDATPAQAAAWVKRQRARGVVRPVIYCSVSQARTVLDDLAKAGISRFSIRLWTAHYTHVPHRCNAKCGFGLNATADATQFTDRALGRSLDESLCADNFFGAVKPAVDKKRLAAVRERLRHIQALLRDKGISKGRRYVLQVWAKSLRKWIRRNK